MKRMPVQPEDLARYKLDVQEAFQMGAAEGGCPADGEILPETALTVL